MWQDFINNGIVSFDRRCWHDAEQFYYNAIEQIEIEWADDRENFQLFMAWISGLHKLSSLFEAQEQELAALRYLTILHHWMLAMIRDNSFSAAFRAMASEAWLNEEQQLLH
jgi:hypothetical protein